MKAGFTLLELSMVLVIIGLLVGGILVGKDLIKAAQERATVADVEKLKSSIRAFQLKYNCLPGDCINATDYFGSSGACPSLTSSGTCNGNGDGIYYPWALETIYAQDQLIRANLSKPGNGGPFTYFALGIRGLDGEGNGFAFIFTNDYSSAGNGSLPVNGISGNTISLVSSSGNCINGVVLTAKEAMDIDTKLDDGQAGTGQVFGLDGGQPIPAAGACGAAVTCLSGGSYNITSSTASCRMLVYW